MDWVRHFLGGDRSPLGFKRLRGKSKRVAEFLQAHPGLTAVKQARQHGSAGWFVPAMADTGNKMSVYASFFFMDALMDEAPELSVGIVGSGQAFGSTLEDRIATGLQRMVKQHDLDFIVSTKGDTGPRVSFQLTDYWPYSTPPSRQADDGDEQAYRALGRGHLIQPDVIVWKERPLTFTKVVEGEARPFVVEGRHLFACISGKATIRSDRSQSSRYEGAAMSRWRRARPPHIVVVTTEPVPSRLGSLAWGLGDLDCVYHVNLSALYDAVTRAEEECGRRARKTAGSSEELKDLVEHARLKDVSQLFDDLFGEVLPSG